MIQPERPRTVFVYLVLLLVLLAALMQYATSGNVAYTTDSLTYRDGARNFLAGHPMQVTNTASKTPERLPSLQWPSGYPALWAATSSLLGFDIDRAAAVLNLALLLICAAILYWILLLSTCSAAVATAATLACMSSPAVMVVFGHAWSEGPYLALSLLAYALLLKFRDMQQARYLLLAGLCVGLANWTRYTGVLLFPLLAITATLLSRQPIRKRLLMVLIPLVVAGLVVAPLWLGNYLHSGTISGSHRGGPSPLGLLRVPEDAQTLLQLLGYCLLSFNTLFRAHIEVPMSAVLLYLMISRIRKLGIKAMGTHQVWLALLWFGANIAFLLYARVVQKTVDLDFRMISVAVPFLFIAVASLLTGPGIPRGEFIGKVLGSVIVTIILYTGVSEAERVRKNYQVGNSPSWRANFALVYRDLTLASPSARALAEELNFIPVNSLVATDFRPLYIRYLMDAKVYSAYTENECHSWVRNEDGGYLVIGQESSMAWAVRCVEMNSTWNLHQVKGAGAPSLQVR